MDGAFANAWPAGAAAVSTEPAALPSALAVYSRRRPAGLAAAAHWRAMPEDADAVAHELFAVLRTLDRLGVDEIWVEQPPAGAAWEGVRDRLGRAAA
jgi:L-threonylcarbamoyladenylate synthase